MRALDGLDGAALYQRFRELKQEPLRLQIALQAYFAPETGDEARAAYGDYLQKRIRPAVAALTEAEDVEKLEALERLGWLRDEQLDGFLQTAREQRRTASLAWLLQLKRRRGAYHARDFSL